MEIKANNESTLKVISLTKEYKAIGIMYFCLAIFSMILFFMIDSLFAFIVMCAISFFGMVFMYYNYSQLKDDTYELTDCYIRLSKTHLEFKQLVNGKYQIGKIFINDIYHIMKVEEGFQIWFKNEAGNSLYMIDDDIVDSAETVCINYYSYDPEEYITLYLEFLELLPETTKKELDTAEWKEASEIAIWVKMMFPAILYLIPTVLSIMNVL